MSLGATLRIGIHKRDHFDVRIADIGLDIQVVDPTKTDKSSPHGPVIGKERHITLLLSRRGFCRWCEIVPLMRLVSRPSAVSGIPERRLGG